MTCDCCDNPATVFLTQIVGDSMQKVNLCETCSASQGVTDPTGFALADLLTGIGAEKKLDRPRSNETRCPDCGFAHSDFKKTGRLGCPECYRVFRTSLKPILSGMHRGTRHTGKVPAHFVPEEQEEARSPGEGQEAESGAPEVVGQASSGVADAPPPPSAPGPDPQDANPLEEALARAVEEENYEEAARLRDEIQKRGSGQ